MTPNIQISLDNQTSLTSTISANASRYERSGCVVGLEYDLIQRLTLSPTRPHYTWEDGWNEPSKTAMATSIRHNIPQIEKYRSSKVCDDPGDSESYCDPEEYPADVDCILLDYLRLTLVIIIRRGNILLGRCMGRGREMSYGARGRRGSSGCWVCRIVMVRRIAVGEGRRRHYADWKLCIEWRHSHDPRDNNQRRRGGGAGWLNCVRVTTQRWDDNEK